MIIDRVFHNIKCDSCGALIDEETWWDDKDALATDILRDCNWIECEGGRHYCDECYSHDDDDNIVTKDGRKWTDYDHKEIRQYHMNYLANYPRPWFHAKPMLPKGTRLNVKEKWSNFFGTYYRCDHENGEYDIPVDKAKVVND